jgi:hypothetical protein
MVLKEGFSLSKIRNHHHQCVCIAGRHASSAIKEFSHFKVILAFEGALVIDSLQFGCQRFREKTIYLLERASAFITRYSYKMFDID